MSSRSQPRPERRADEPRSTGFERIRVLVRKEFLQLLRDPKLRRILFVTPILQLIVFGYAVSTDVRNTATFVVDHDHTQPSRALLASLTAGGWFTVIGQSDRSSDLVLALDHGRAVMGIEIPAGFARDLAQSNAEVQLIFDGSNSNVATVARGYAEQIVQSHGVRAVAARVGAGARAPAIDFRERAWFNPALVSRNYNVPGVLGILIMLICFLLTSLAVVREREIGTLEQLMVSPLRGRELIAGKTIPFAMIALADMVVITIVALLWFRVPFRGSALLLLAATLFYTSSGLGIGLLISTVSRTQQEAFMTAFLILIPTILLSGFMFPVSSMPVLFQWLTLLNPVRHYLEIVRGVFLKGIGVAALWPQFLALLALGIALLGLAGTRFRKVSG
jgi:ABC-2 type transport system permease protein